MQQRQNYSRSYFILFGLLTAFLFIFANRVWAEAAIWEAKGKKNTVYLFGSIHLANQSMYPLGKKIQSAFEQADVLVVEVDETQVDQVKMQQLLMSKGFYPGTETIKDHVSDETMKLLQEFINSAGIPYATIARMRPGIMALTLTVAKFVQMGYSPEYGIDRHFMEKARGNKPVQQLESADSQMELLLSFSDDDLLLQQTLVSLQEMEKMIHELITAWTSGDTKSLQKLMLTDQLKEHPEFTAIYKKLIDDRNVTMSRSIGKMLKDNKSYFVVVGAGHLVGEKGVISLLKNQGYTVNRL